jgi:hypothetical protein
VSTNAGQFGGYAFTVEGGYTGSCASRGDWSVQVANNGNVSHITNLFLLAADVGATPPALNCAVTVTDIVITSTPSGAADFDYTVTSPFTVSTTLANPPATFTTTASLPPFPQIIFDGTFGNAGTFAAPTIDLDMYFALTASTLNSITSGSYSVTPTASNVPPPTFGATLTANADLAVSGGLFTDVKGGYKFKDLGVGANAVVVYGPVDTTNNSIYKSGTPVYDLCFNAPTPAPYATVEAWYVDYSGSNTGDGASGGTPPIGTSWNLAYGAAGTVGGVTYQYGFGYANGNTAPADDQAAILFQYNTGGIDTFEVFCLSIDP